MSYSTIADASFIFAFIHLDNPHKIGRWWSFVASKYPPPNPPYTSFLSIHIILSFATEVMVFVNCQ